MKFIILFVLMQSALAMIDNGIPALPGQFLGIVKIHLSMPDGIGVCTGTLIAPRLVLTAAHCAPAWLTSIEVSSYGDTEGAPRFLVSGIYKPKRYVALETLLRPHHEPKTNEEAAQMEQLWEQHGDEFTANDLALLVLAEAQPINNTVLPTLACAPLPNRSQVAFAGFGINKMAGFEEDCNPQGVLLFGLDRLEDRTYDYYVTQEPSSGNRLNSGDSGGPLMNIVDPGVIYGVASNTMEGEKENDPVDSRFASVTTPPARQFFQEVLAEGTLDPLSASALGLCD